MFSAPALKCGARDRWIGWDRGVQFSRLHLVTSNSRFLILPGAERNLGSRVLSLCTRRLVRDWPARFGHDVLLAEALALDCYSILRRVRCRESLGDQGLQLTRDLSYPSSFADFCGPSVLIPKFAQL